MALPNSMASSRRDRLCKVAPAVLVLTLDARRIGCRANRASLRGMSHQFAKDCIMVVLLATDFAHVMFDL
jgi:hypothetical protein